MKFGLFLQKYQNLEFSSPVNSHTNIHFKQKSEDIWLVLLLFTVDTHVWKEVYVNAPLQKHVMIHSIINYTMFVPVVFDAHFFFKFTISTPNFL